MANNDIKLLRWSFKLRNAQLWTQTTYSTRLHSRLVTAVVPVVWCVWRYAVVLMCLLCLSVPSTAPLNVTVDVISSTVSQVVDLPTSSHITFASPSDEMKNS